MGWQQMIKNNFRWLLIANLKRDTKVIALWIVINVAMVVSGVSKLATLYGTNSEIASLKSMMDSPMIAALFGRLPDVHPMTTAVLFGALMMAMMGVLAAIMNIQIAIRGTRGDEESGATELIRSRAIKTTLPLSVMMTELLLVNILSALFMFIGSATIAMNGANIAGYALFAGSLAIFGLMFGAISVLAAQLFAEARSASLFSFAVLLLTYGMRSVVDAEKHYPAWHIVSPFNWLEDMQIFAQNRISYLVPMLLVILIAFAASYWMIQRRDLGAGIIQGNEHGRAKAGPMLRGFVTLFIRLERKLVLGWTIGLIFLGGMYGGLFAQVGKMVDTSPELQQILGVNAIHRLQNQVYSSFLAMIIVFMAAMAIFAAVMVMQRQNKDARSGAYDLISGSAVTRTRLFWTYTVGGVVTGLLTWTVGLLTLWLAASQTVSQKIPHSMFIKALWGYMPTIVLAVGIVAIFIGWFPRLIGILYGYFGVFFLLTYMKNMFHVPVSLLKFSPFGWTYHLPVTNVSMTTLVGMLTLAILLMIVGYIGYRRRDLV